jgi:hypothetical protein
VLPIPENIFFFAPQKFRGNRIRNEKKVPEKFGRLVY